jgi:DNA polymerase elongation subunit (family B)
MNVQFQIIDWYAVDEAESESDLESESSELVNLNYNIYVFGKTIDGKNITCKIKDFKPFYYIKVKDMNKKKYNQLLEYIKTHYALREFGSNALNQQDIKIIERKDIMGFRNNKKYQFLRLSFNSVKAMHKSKYIFKKAVGIFNTHIKFKLYESNFDPFLRYCHIQNLKTVGWVEINKYRKSGDIYEIDHHDIINIDRHDIAPFLQMSWDIECYSYNYEFPDPRNIKNEIYQIGCVFEEYGNDGNQIQYIFTLKHTDLASTDNLNVIECKTERDLLLQWVKLIATKNPDIMYSYNGDVFDTKYISERAKLLNIESQILSRISRLSEHTSVIKKEVFSSSAYGDNDYVRLYIPGRLNYDLLIHYKRGMKKYASYSLNNISNDILKEKKHPVSAKDIFRAYETGDRHDIGIIASYCIQDCALLQKLVNKQKILLSIIQLANVTFVPISFLVSRGQTIKVYSQILRKAMQMGFLVPHTNFNEDLFPLLITFKNDHNLDTTDINTRMSFPIKKDSKTIYIGGKITDITSNNSIIILSDTELTHDYHSINIKIGNVSYATSHIKVVSEDIDTSFTGATVLTATPGFRSECVSVLDFASLYPTCMISRNLCYSTMLLDDKYKNIPGVIYENIKWDDKIEYKLNHKCQEIVKATGAVCGKQAFYEQNTRYFCRIHDPEKKTRPEDEKYQKRDVSYDYTIIQPNQNTNENRGVVATLLEELFAERKAVKRKIKDAYQSGDNELADIYDNLQLAIKVSLNSIYGFMGRNVGSLIMKPLGAITTYIGRTLLETTQDYTEQKFTQHVIDNNLLTYTLNLQDLSGVSLDAQKKLLDKCRVEK